MNSFCINLEEFLQREFKIEARVYVSKKKKHIYHVMNKYV